MGKPFRFINLFFLTGCLIFTAKGFPQTVRYGSIVKLKHVLTNQQLHSHEINLSHPKSSKQQMVVAFSGDDDNDFWIVKGPNGQTDKYKAGDAVQSGDIIRLTHKQTQKNLHSHAGVPSPVTKQQEVTAFGTNGAGDEGDNWKVDVEGGGPWEEGKRIQFINAATGKFLHSHRGFSHPQFTAGMQEVTAFDGPDDNNWWFASYQIIPDDIIKLSRKKIRREMLKVAVVDFAERGDLGVKDAGSSVAEWFTTALQKTGAFDIYERISMQKLMDEYKLGMTGIADEKTMAQIGKVRGVQAIVTGSVLKFQNTISLTVKLIDTETAKIIDSADIKTKSMDNIPLEIDNLAWELATTD